MSRFSMISIYSEVFLLEIFWNNLNCASTAIIEGVMNFCNLGDKSFETDFNLLICF